MRGIKKTNNYVDSIVRLYRKTPKAVFAAIAVSYAMRLYPEEPNIEEMLLEEWRTLNVCGIIPQKQPNH